RRHFKLQTPSVKSIPAEEGIADMMVHLYRHFARPLSQETLFTWHRFLTRGRKDLKKMGAYRTHLEPMQIVSGAIYQPKIHFEAPPSHQMHQEMKGFIRWFNDTSPKGKTPLSPLIRAGIAHLYFVSIHPFEDGNGRIARALVEKALSQALGQPTLIALSQIIQDQKKDYYKRLELNNKGLEITDWLQFFFKIILKGQRFTQNELEFLIEKTKFYEKFREQLNERQLKVIQRIFEEGSKGFQGGLSAENYIRITKTSRATATRDLQNLLDQGVLFKTGELRHTRYYLRMNLMNRSS
ncbi:MAG: Fic family protein, partial [Deltaproteobacteria bacterium]|nr:Fic family protein [Deltaproteobacteria bacterium]